MPESRERAPSSSKFSNGQFQSEPIQKSQPPQEQKELSHKSEANPELAVADESLYSEIAESHKDTKPEEKESIKSKAE